MEKIFEQFREKIKAKREGVIFPLLVLGMGYVGHRLFCNYTITN